MEARMVVLPQLPPPWLGYQDPHGRRKREIRQQYAGQNKNSKMIADTQGEEELFSGSPTYRSRSERLDIDSTR